MVLTNQIQVGGFFFFFLQLYTIATNNTEDYFIQLPPKVWWVMNCFMNDWLCFITLQGNGGIFFLNHDMRVLNIHLLFHLTYSFLQYWRCCTCHCDQIMMFQYLLRKTYNTSVLYLIEMERAWRFLIFCLPMILWCFVGSLLTK